MKKFVPIFVILTLALTFVFASDATTQLTAHLIGIPIQISIQVPDSIDFGNVEAGHNYNNTSHSKRIDVNNTGNTAVNISFDISPKNGIFENLYLSETKSNPLNDYHYSEFHLYIDAPINQSIPETEHFYAWLDLRDVTAQVGNSIETGELIYTAVPA